jgi:hypothetical protein
MTSVDGVTWTTYARLRSAVSTVTINGTTPVQWIKIQGQTATTWGYSIWDAAQSRSA